MMSTYYTNDRTTQIVLYLLKAHGIRKVIVSPGTTTVTLVASMQIDPYFELYSAVDERSAAYMACGLAYESGEPVVLSCTEATASRNYFPGLTEAYYRKLPVLAITGCHGSNDIGHLRPQVIDRSEQPVDTVKMSISLGKCKSQDDEWFVNVQTNKALLELTRNGGGPVHINLSYSGSSFLTRNLPSTRVIKRYSQFENVPPLPIGRIAIFVGSHKKWSDDELNAIDSFCANHNAVVFCDKTSGYLGKYRIDYALIAAQSSYTPHTNNPDLLIHIGEVSGDTYTQGSLKPQSVWRVSEDGEVRDTFKRLKNVFSMPEKIFFTLYKDVNPNNTDEYLNACKKEYESIVSQAPNVEFSNVWIAQTLIGKLPKQSILHLSIFNSFRSWNFAPTRSDIQTICNVGGFGIDGTLSTLLGASIANPDILHFAVIGDLAFFYDMNSLGNRYVSNNIRILLINNGRGTEFRNYDHPCVLFGEEADSYMAAAGHFGYKSTTLVKNYALSLGFKYLTASTKEDFLNMYEQFTDSNNREAPMILEAFTDSKDDSNAVYADRHIIKECALEIKNKAKRIVKDIIKR